MFSVWVCSLGSFLKHACFLLILHLLVTVRETSELILMLCYFWKSYIINSHLIYYFAASSSPYFLYTMVIDYEQIIKC